MLLDLFSFFCLVFLKLLVSNKVRERSKQVQGTWRNVVQVIRVTGGAAVAGAGLLKALRRG